MTPAAKRKYASEVAWQNLQACAEIAREYEAGGDEDLLQERTVEAWRTFIARLQEVHSKAEIVALVEDSLCGP